MLKYGQYGPLKKVTGGEGFKLAPDANLRAPVFERDVGLDFGPAGFTFAPSGCPGARQLALQFQLYSRFVLRGEQVRIEK